MSDLEKRITDLEYMVAHIPEDLDARFAGVSMKFAEMREILALHTTRFTKLEARLMKLETRLDTMDRKLDQIIGKLGA